MKLKNLMLMWFCTTVGAAFLGGTIPAHAMEIDPMEAFKTLGWAGVFLTLYLMQFYDHKKQRDTWEQTQKDQIDKLLKVLTDNSEAMNKLTHAIETRVV